MKISIIIICDKIRQEKLERLLFGIKPQLKDNVEVILIHESNVKLECPSFPVKVHYFNVPEKQGIPYNRNRGIEKSSGEIIVFIDDDCWVSAGWLEALVGPFDVEKIMVTTSGTHIPHSNFFGDCVSALGFPGGGSLGFENVWRVSSEGFTNHLAAGNCAFRREVFDVIGLFDETLKSGAEDAELSYRIEKAGIPIKYVPNGYAFHEARTTWTSFVSWQIRRGRANYHFKQKVGAIGGFLKLRLWSTKNILIKNKFNWRLPMILFLLFMSFLLQQEGFVLEKKKQR